MSDDGFVSMGDTVLIRIEENLVFIRNQRIMTFADFQAILDVSARVRRAHGSLFAMYDSSRSEGVERAARKAMTENLRPDARPDAMAIFGAAFAIRTLGNMIDRARMGLGQPTTGIRFFQTEAEAREYLARERLRLQSKG
jgi:hypothetical protein